MSKKRSKNKLKIPPYRGIEGIPEAKYHSTFYKDYKTHFNKHDIQETVENSFVLIYRPIDFISGMGL